MSTNTTALHTTAITLQPVAPFDFNQSLAFIGEFSPTQAEQTMAHQSLTKGLRILDQTVAFRLQNTGSIETPALTCTIYAQQPITQVLCAAICDRVRFFLSLDDALTPFYTLGAQDLPFAQVIQRLYGYHQVKFLTPFENTCWAILTQRTPLAVARGIKQRLTEAYGGSIEVDGITFAAFPAAQDFDPINTEALTTMVGNARKASYLASAIAAFREVDEQWLRTGSYAEVNAWLRSIKGIGEWSALFVLIRGLGRGEQALTADQTSKFTQEIHKAATAVYGPLTMAQLQGLARHYADWQGYWGHYLRALPSS